VRHICVALCVWSQFRATVDDSRSVFICRWYIYIYIYIYYNFMCRVIVVPAIGCTSVEHSSNHCDACMLTGMPFALSIHVQINIYMYIYIYTHV